MPLFERLDILANAPKRSPKELTHGYFDTGKRLRDLAGQGDQPLDVVVYGRPVTFTGDVPPTDSYIAGTALHAAKAREVPGIPGFRNQQSLSATQAARISAPASTRLAALQPPLSIESLSRFGATPLQNDPFGVSLRSHLRRIVKDA